MTNKRRSKTTKTTKVQGTPSISADRNEWYHRWNIDYVEPVKRIA